MQITLDPNIGAFTIRSYQPGKILVNSRVIQRSIILTPDELIETWPPQNFTELTKNHLETLLSNKPEIVILGTGAIQHFLSPELTDLFYHNKIGLEVMATDAACRTYNVLISEGRKVTAGLLIG